MEYWSDGMMKTRVWRNDIGYYLNGAVHKINSDHNPLLIPKIPLFSPIRRLCEPEATTPLFHGLSDGKLSLRDVVKARSSEPGLFTSAVSDSDIDWIAYLQGYVNN
jgi:hypothetical protein